MCLLIHQPKGVTLPRHVLDSAARKNPDGFGIMFHDGERVHTFRMVGTAEEFTREYYKRAAGRECFVHWRMTTHGATNKANAHPFRLSPTCAIMHNGIIDIETPNRAMSDTWHFAEYVARPALIAGVIRSPEWLAVARGIIGRGSKVAILHADGSHVILNRESGVEHNGVWYSNTYAWDAPASLMSHAARGYARGYDRWVGVEWDARPSSRALTSSVERTIDRDIERETDNGAYVGLLSALDVTDENPANAVARWATENSEAAALILCDWFNFSPDEARDLARNKPMDAADYLLDVAESMS